MEEAGQKRRQSFINLLKTDYKLGEKVPSSAIYECSECANVTAFKKAEHFTECENCARPIDDQSWYRTNQILHFVTKNLNDEFDRLQTFSIKLADWITEKAGTIGFVYFHVVWFGFWILVNTGHPMFGVPEFDPYPFGLLTMIVSLEAIFLATFIMISQNLQAQRSELRAELDYQTNLKAEKGVSEILAILKEMRDEEQQVDETTQTVLSTIKKKERVSKRERERQRKIKKVLESAGIKQLKE